MSPYSHKPAPVGAGSRELVLTALVREKGIDLSFKGAGIINTRAYSDLSSAFHSFCEVLRFKAHELPLTVTLKIEPVNAAPEVDAAS